MSEQVKLHIKSHSNGDRTFEITMPNGDILKRKTNHPYEWAVVARLITAGSHWQIVGFRVREYDARKLSPSPIEKYESWVLPLGKGLEMSKMIESMKPEIDKVAKMNKIETCYHWAFPTTIHSRNKKDEIINKMVKLWDEDPKHEPTVALLVSFAKSAGGS
jgi:hypothetical protein